jgi:hypothetical protein
MKDSKGERMVVVVVIIIIIIIVIQMKNMPYLRAKNLKESAIIAVNMDIESELVGSKIPARNQMVVAVVEVVNSKILLPDEGAMIKEVTADKEDVVVEDSAEHATIVRKLTIALKTVKRKREMKVARQQQLQQASQHNNNNNNSGNGNNKSDSNYNSYSNKDMTEMMCITMDPGVFGDDELLIDEFEDLSEPEYKLLTQDEASDDKEEEKSEEESSEESEGVDPEIYKGVFTKEEIEDYKEHLKIRKRIRKERKRENLQ